MYSACSDKDQSVWESLYKTQKKLERSEAQVQILKKQVDQYQFAHSEEVGMLAQVADQKRQIERLTEEVNQQQEIIKSLDAQLMTQAGGKQLSELREQKGKLEEMLTQTTRQLDLSSRYLQQS